MRPPCADLSALYFSEDPHEQALAVRLCNGCPFQRTCAARALVVKPTSGIWAGVLVGHKGIASRTLLAAVADGEAWHRPEVQRPDRGLAHQPRREPEAPSPERYRVRWHGSRSVTPVA